MDASFAVAQDHRQFQSPMPAQQQGYPHHPQPSHQSHLQHHHQQSIHHPSMSSSVGAGSEVTSQSHNARRPSRSSYMPSLGSPPPAMALPPPPPQAFSSQPLIQSQQQLPRSASQASLGTSTSKPSRGPSPSATHPRHPYSVSSASQSYTDGESEDYSDKDYYHPPPMQQHQRTSRHTSLQQQPKQQLYQQQQARQQQLNSANLNSLYRHGSASSVNSTGDYYNPPASLSLNSPVNGYSPTAGYSPDAAYARDSYSTTASPLSHSQPRRDGQTPLSHGIGKFGSSGGVSPGSYFAAYPPSSGSSPSTVPSHARRDRASSNASENLLEYLSPEPRSVGDGATNGKHGTAGLESSPGSSNMRDTDSSGPSTSSYLEPRPPQAQASHSNSLQPQPQAGSQSSSRSPGSRHRDKDRTRTRPSSRRALTAALELAKSAVQLDTTSDDPHGAVLAYAKSVQLLGEVMERVMRGESTTGSHHTESSSSGSATGTREPSDGGEERRKSGRRRSVVAKEEEVRKLKAIHDTYADRMRILCLIYSIEIPQFKPSPLLGPTPSRTPQREASSDIENDGDRYGAVPDAPEDVSATSDAETDTIKRAHSIQRGADEDAYDQERRDGSSRMGDEDEDLQASTDQEQELETGPLERHESNTPTSLIVPSLSNNEPHTPSSSSTVTPRASYAPPPPPQRSASNLILNTNVVGIAQARSISLQDVMSPSSSSNGPMPPISVMSPTSHGRASMLPPPRPPPTAPLPTRPRMPSGSALPSQLLNQPLPPLPPTTSPPASKEKILDASQQTLTRHSSASSISGASGTSTTASGSSSASVPSSVTSLAPSGIGALPSNTGIVGRPRGNSNAHARNTSIAERLGALSEEKEEDDSVNAHTTTKIPKDSAGSSSPSDVAKSPTPPPPEFKYRSRSSSMVSLKDRDRAKAQVLGVNNPLPPPPLPTSTNASPQIPQASIVPRNESSSYLFPVPSPNRAAFDSQQISRERGGSVGSSATQMSEDYVMDISRSRANSVIPPYTAGGVPAPESAPIVVGALGSSDHGAIKISSSPSSGTISQRRNKNSLTNPQADGPSAALHKLTSAVLPASTANSLGLTGRSRAASNPGKRPGNITSMSLGDPTSRPPMPPPPMSARITRQFPGINITRYQPFGLSSQTGNVNASTASLGATATAGAPIAGTPASSFPPPPPSNAVLRPYYLMSLLRKSMTDRTGGYITTRLHVPHEVWTQGSAKLTNTAEKTKVVALLVAALDELSNASVEFCGVTTGIATSTSSGKGGRKEGETWAKKLEEFERAFGQVGETFGKKLGVGSGFVVKKSVGMAAWSNKLFDKIATAGKGYDSPAAYSTLLASFFSKVQLLEEHTQALHSSQSSCYSTLPKELSTRIEGTTKSISELFARVVLTFVFRDLSLMLDKYHKTCDRWIQSNPGTQG